MGGFLLTLLNPIKLHSIIVLLTQHELSQDPNDLVANFLLGVSSKFSVGSQHFGIIYLLSHGAVKLFLVSMLWQKKLWAYPVASFFLGLFIIYQIYRYSFSHSLWLMALILVDMITILLILAVYKKDIRNTGDAHL